MIDKHLIEKKLRKIEGYLKELETVNIENLNGFRKNIVEKRFIERNIELSIEQMVDICKHFISGLDLSEPETYSECFDIIGKAGIIPLDRMNVFKAMVRYRNILIHAYDDIDDSITYGIYRKNLDDFRTFVKIIREYISQ
jgi:uncharacterized protein YutE (UPF0331/DUF86 family)